jgi:hypothetical protein
MIFVYLAKAEGVAEPHVRECSDNKALLTFR